MSRAATKSPPLPARFVAFTLVGGLCFALNVAVLWGLTSRLGIHYLLSTVIAFSTITPLSFLLNKLLTFRTRRELTPVELARYLLSMAASFSANLALMYLLVSVVGMWYISASLLIAATLLVANFAVSDRWSFRVRP